MIRIEVVLVNPVLRVLNREPGERKMQARDRRLCNVFGEANNTWSVGNGQKTAYESLETNNLRHVSYKSCILLLGHVNSIGLAPHVTVKLQALTAECQYHAAC